MRELNQMFVEQENQVCTITPEHLHTKNSSYVTTHLLGSSLAVIVSMWRGRCVEVTTVAAVKDQTQIKVETERFAGQ